MPPTFRSDLQYFTRMVIEFRDKRGWKQFHNPKDLALSLVLEATEVMEHFQWKNNEELSEYIKVHKEEIGDELSDVLYWILLISHDLEINISKAFRQKMVTSRKKYPVLKAKNNHKKYTEL